MSPLFVGGWVGFDSEFALRKLEPRHRVYLTSSLHTVSPSLRLQMSAVLPFGRREASRNRALSSPCAGHSWCRRAG